MKKENLFLTKCLLLLLCPLLSVIVIIWCWFICKLYTWLSICNEFISQRDLGIFILVLMVLFVCASINIIYRYINEGCDGSNSCNCCAGELDCCSLKYLESEVLQFLMIAMSKENYESLIKVENNKNIEDNQSREYLINTGYVKNKNKPDNELELTSLGKMYLQLRQKLNN